MILECSALHLQSTKITKHSIRPVFSANNKCLPYVLAVNGGSIIYCRLFIQTQTLKFGANLL